MHVPVPSYFGVNISRMIFIGSRITDAGDEYFLIKCTLADGDLGRWKDYRNLIKLPPFKRSAYHR